MKERVLKGLVYLAICLVALVLIASAIATAAFLVWLALFAVEPLTGWLATYVGFLPKPTVSLFVGLILIALAAIVCYVYKVDT